MSVVVNKGKLVALCFSKWSTFGVGWPPVGTFDWQMIKAVEERVFRPGSLRHSDQVPYIVTWKNLVEDSPHLMHKSFFTQDPPHRFWPSERREKWEEGSGPEKKSILQDPSSADLLLQEPLPVYLLSLAPIAPPASAPALGSSAYMGPGFTRGRSRSRAPTSQSYHGDLKFESHLP